MLITVPCGVSPLALSTTIMSLRTAVSVALTLLIIVRRLLLRHNVLAKQLPIVETLGCVNMLLSDKTGTLTTGVMTVCASTRMTSAPRTTQQSLYFGVGEVQYP